MATVSELKGLVDNLAEKQDAIHEDIKAILVQATKTNGRVNGLEDWRDRHEADSVEWRKKIQETLDSMNKTLTMYTGGLILLSILGAGIVGFITLTGRTYVDNLKHELTRTIIAELADKYEIAIK
jgi:hypothetical protein